MLWLCISAFFQIATSHGGHSHGDEPSLKSADIDFIGKSYWSESYFERCDQRVFELHDNPAYICARFMIDYSWVDVEVLSKDPILVVFHKFFALHDALEFRKYIHQKELKAMSVVDHEKDSQSTMHDSRRANGTWLTHHENDITSKLFNFAQRRIPTLNFDAAEQWHALSYQPGGHYAPHFDFLDYPNADSWDWWMKEHGQRLATFLAVLETAEQGGGTLFPELSYAVHPEVGDVMLWLNMEAENLDKANKSLHGACPILKGQKTAATLWIRISASFHSFKTSRDGPTFNITQLIRPYGIRPPDNYAPPDKVQRQE
ncbi:unnamed protein product, partial [Mesorhabditis spiculigera]